MKTVTGMKDTGITLREWKKIDKFQKSYNVETKEEYTKQLSRLNLVDIQNHAMKLGIVPLPDRRRLERVLINEFEQTKYGYITATRKIEDKPELSDEKKAKALEILAKHFK